MGGLRALQVAYKVITNTMHVAEHKCSGISYHLGSFDLTARLAARFQMAHTVTNLAGNWALQLYCSWQPGC
jgi:hypothetical protein